MFKTIRIALNPMTMFGAFVYSILEFVSYFDIRI